MSCKHLLPSRRRRRQRCALEGLFIGPPTAACQLPPWEEGYCPEAECPWRNRGYKPLPVDYAGIRGSSLKGGSPMLEGSVPERVLRAAERKGKKGMMDKAALAGILASHAQWLQDPARGQQADLRTNLRGADLRGTDLRGANLRGAYLEGAGLRGANLRGANLGGAYLRGASLGCADLGGANLGGAYLRGSDLGGADLGDAYLGGADLRGANLGDAYLGGAGLGGAYLGGAYLGGSDLGDADLGGAYLGDADLRGTNLRGTNLRGAYLGGANLDFASWPLWCGTIGAKIDLRLVRQLAAHICVVECEDKEAKEVQALLLPYAQKCHRAHELGLLKEK